MGFFSFAGEAQLRSLFFYFIEFASRGAWRRRNAHAMAGRHLPYIQTGIDRRAFSHQMSMYRMCQEQVDKLRVNIL